MSTGLRPDFVDGVGFLSLAFLRDPDFVATVLLRALDLPDTVERSARDLEVLQLLTEGCTDREIADRLSISYRTAMQYVANILGKLKVNSRTAASAFALRHRLA